MSKETKKLLEALKELVRLYEAIEVKPGHAPAHYTAKKIIREVEAK